MEFELHTSGFSKLSKLTDIVLHLRLSQDNQVSAQASTDYTNCTGDKTGTTQNWFGLRWCYWRLFATSLI